MKNFDINTEMIQEEILVELLEHYLNNDSNLTYSSTDAEYIKEANSFLDNSKKEITFQDLSSIDLNLENRKDIFPDTFNDVDVFEFNLGFYNFYSAIKDILSNYDSKFINFKGSDRQKSPPIKAYNFVGHNKELTNPKNSYSYLSR